MPSNRTPNVRNTSDQGTVEEVNGRYVLRFERRLLHPREEVWDALTRPERMQEWFGEGDIELDLVDGGKFEVHTTGPPALVEAIIAEVGKEGLVQHNRVLRVQPPAVFEHTFGDPDSVVRWELEPDGDGCRLKLAHTEPAGFVVAENGPRDLAGWHALLELLAKALDGEPAGRAPWRLERWQELRDQYAS
jgi:uncharacterized protein YndB with AHSA1/START domain